MVLLWSWSSSMCGLQVTLQLGSAGLPSPAFASNTEPLHPLLLDLVQGRASGMAGLPMLHPHHSLSVGRVLWLWQILLPRRTFFPIWLCAMTFLKLSLLDQQNRLSVVLKENYWTVKPRLIIFLAAIVLFFLLLTVYLQQLPLPPPTGILLFLMFPLKKRKLFFKEENEAFIFSFHVYCYIFFLYFQDISRHQK